MGLQPPNFSWVLPGRLAGLALPRLPAHYQFLLDQGVRHLVSLTERGPPHNDSCPGLTLHRLSIPDFRPPAPEQIDRFVQIVDEANAQGEVSGRGQRREEGAWKGSAGTRTERGKSGPVIHGLERDWGKTIRTGDNRCNPDVKPRGEGGAGSGRRKES